MRITCLGSATFDPKQKESFSLLLEDEHVCLLVDCGPYAMQGLSAIGRLAGDIDMLFLSHTHADHAAGVPWLLYSRMFEQWYGTSELNEALDLLTVESSTSAFLKYLDEQNLATSERGSAPGVIKSIRPNERFRIGAHSGYCFPVVHTVDTFGLRVDNERGSFVFLPDSDVHKSSALEEALRNATVVVAACGGGYERNAEWARYGFSACRDVATLCANANVRAVKFFHMFYHDEIPAALNEARLACPRLDVDSLRTGEIVEF